MNNEIAIGDKVRCFITVCGEKVPMHAGIVVGIHDGYYMVDRMKQHGGAPWISAEQFVIKENSEEK